MNKPGEHFRPEAPLILTESRRAPADASEKRFQAIAVCFLASDGLIFAAQINPLLAAASCTALVCQCGLLAVWASMGPGYWPVRQLQALGLGAAGCVCACVGAGLMGFGAGPGSGNLAQDAAVAFLLFLGWQAPLWACRLLLGWRIDRPTAEPTNAVAAARQFGILDLLLLTALVAAPLGSLRLGFSHDAKAFLELICVCLGAAVFSVLTTLPCLWSALGARNQDAGCLAIVLYSTAFGVLLLFGGAAMLSVQDDGAIAALLALSFSVFFAGGITHAALAGFRDDGYRLVRLQR